MKKSTWWIIAGIVITLMIFFLLLFFRGVSDEDDWIKDSKGIWIKHGNPSSTPQEVQQQQQLLSKVNASFEQYKLTTSQIISSQCLGTIDNYAIDIVHVPRTSEDNLPQNQCQAYVNGSVLHFIELDKEGNIVRIK